MPIYRYLAVQGDVPIRRPVPLESDDVAEAIELVRLRQERADCELWFGPRKVAIVPKDRAPAIRLDE
jgi:hypothetical protein